MNVRKTLEAAFDSIDNDLSFISCLCGRSIILFIGIFCITVRSRCLFILFICCWSFLWSKRRLRICLVIFRGFIFGLLEFNLYIYGVNLLGSSQLFVFNNTFSGIKFRYWRSSWIRVMIILKCCCLLFSRVFLLSNFLLKLLNILIMSTHNSAVFATISTAEFFCLSLLCVIRISGFVEVVGRLQAIDCQILGLLLIGRLVNSRLFLLYSHIGCAREYIK